MIQLSAAGEIVFVDGGEGYDNIYLYGYVYTDEGTNSYLESGEATVYGGSDSDYIYVYDYPNTYAELGTGDDRLNIENYNGNNSERLIVYGGRI